MLYITLKCQHVIMVTDDYNGFSWLNMTYVYINHALFFNGHHFHLPNLTLITYLVFFEWIVWQTFGHLYLSFSNSYNVRIKNVGIHDLFSCYK